MAYETTFEGEFTISPQLTGARWAEVSAYCADRHDGDAPSAWCPWAVSPVGDALRWGGVHGSVWFLWLERLLAGPLSGYEVRGVVYWRGEDPADRGLAEIGPDGLNLRDADSDPVASCLRRLDALDTQEVLGGLEGLRLLGAGPAVAPFLAFLEASEDDRVQAALAAALRGDPPSVGAAGPGPNLPDTPIVELGLSFRAERALSDAGFERLSQFAGLSDADLLVGRGLDPKSLREIREILSEYL